MAISYRIYRYSPSFFKNQSGGSLQQPADSVTITIYRQGARVSSATGSGGSGAVTIPVYDPGSIGIGDTVQINAAGATGTVGSITATTIVTSSTTGALTFAANDRVIVTAAPTLYRDDQGSQVLSPVITGATGGVDFYAYESVLDWVVSGTGITTSVLSDQYGNGLGATIYPFNIGAKFDGSTTDTSSIKKAIDRAKRIGKQEIVCSPGTALIDDVIQLDAIAGLKIRGAGPGLTTWKITDTSKKAVYLTSACSDITFEDMVIEGTSGAARATYLFDDADSTNLTLNRVRFVEGGYGIQLAGTDSTVNQVKFTGNWNGNLIRLNNATRPQISKVRSNLGNYTTAVAVDGNTVGASVDSCDFTHSSGSGVGLYSVGSGVSNLRISNSRFSGGSALYGILIAAGNTITMSNVVCSDSYAGFVISAGTDVTMTGCKAIRSQTQGFYIPTGAGPYTMETCSSSDANQAAGASSHVEIGGGVSNVDIFGLRVGNWSAGTGAQAFYGVLVADGAGVKITVGRVTGIRTDLAGTLLVLNSKANSRNEVYVSDSLGLSSVASTTPRHAGFAFAARGFTGDETTPNVDGANYLSLQYGAGITITDFSNGSSGQLLFVTNTGANAITIADAVSKIQTSTGANVSLAVDKTFCFFKSAKSTRNWEQIVVDGT
jgi:hypothetical protein